MNVALPKRKSPRPHHVTYQMPSKEAKKVGLRFPPYETKAKTYIEKARVKSRTQKPAKK
jgi:hypothetical protein